MRLAVASGKGGTGKTLVATNLAWSLAARRGGVTYVDADVEAPNGHLFFQPDFTQDRASRGAGAQPSVGCGLLGLWAVRAGLPVRGHRRRQRRGARCTRICATRAASACERARSSCWESRSARRAPCAGATRAAWASSTARSTWARCGRCPSSRRRCRRAPGRPWPSSTPPREPRAAAVAAVEGADLVLLVCEPTPFGLHDLELSLQMCEALGLETAAVVNRSDLGDGRVQSFLAAEQVPVLAEVPFDREIATACATGVLASTQVPAFASTVDDLADNLLGRFEPLLQ